MITYGGLFGAVQHKIKPFRVYVFLCFVIQINYDHCMSLLLFYYYGNILQHINNIFVVLNSSQSFQQLFCRKPERKYFTFLFLLSSTVSHAS